MKKLKLKSSGKIYLVYNEKQNNLKVFDNSFRQKFYPNKPDNQIVTTYYCQLEKNGKGWGASQAFTDAQVELLP